MSFAIRILMLLFAVLWNTFISSPKVFSQDVLKINRTKIECDLSIGCEFVNAKLEKFENKRTTKAEIKNLYKELISSPSLRKVEVSVSGDTLIVKAIPIVRIKDIEIEGNPFLEDESLLQKSRVQVGDFVDREKILDTREILEQFLKNSGFRRIVVTTRLELLSDQRNTARFYIEISEAQAKRWSEVKLVISNKELKKKLEPLIESTAGGRADTYQAEEDKRRLSAWLQERGFFRAQVQFKRNPFEAGEVLSFEVNPGLAYSFGFFGELIEAPQYYRSLVNQVPPNESHEKFIEAIREQVLDEYKKLGYFFAKAEIKRKEEGSGVVSFRFFLEKGHRVKIERMSFPGARRVGQKTLRKWVNSYAGRVVERDYFNQQEIILAHEKILQEYQIRGYLLAKVSEPNISFDKEKKKARVSYLIDEGPQTLVRSISFDGNRSIEKKNFLDKLTMKKGEPFNVVAFEDDLQAIQNHYRSKGFLEMRLTNRASDNILVYSDDFKEVDVVLKINEGQQSFAGDIFIKGNERTKTKVIKRKLSFLEKGDILTQEKIRRIEEDLGRMGIFQSVRVQMMDLGEENHRDLYVLLRERSTNTVEAGVGYRTDLGPRVFVEWSQTNIGGYNRSIALQAEANQREDYEDTDNENLAAYHRNNPDYFEYSAEINFFDPWTLGKHIDLQGGLSFRQEYFESFDSRIANINAETIFELSDPWGARLGYQFEQIEQDNAAEDKKQTDEGTFVIGSLLPTLYYNSTDSPGHPTSGIDSSLSFEWAAPIFGSQTGDVFEQNEPKIDFFTIRSRNHVYLPISQDLTLALGVRAGYQENNVSANLLEPGTNNPQVDSEGNVLLAGFIPTIKLFRLGGYDTLRGVREDDLNLDEFRVQSAASFVNFKLEPRYRLSDSFVIGVFVDAGNVYVVNKGDPIFNLDDLFWTTGIGFRYITPVGPLSLDYGINLNDEIGYSGAFHISIGRF
jgi:outer membrane protein insertion porin family